MQIIVSAEVASVFFVAISLISQCTEVENAKSNKALRLCSWIMIGWLLSDVGSYVINGPSYPIWLLGLINLLAYTMGGIGFLSYIRYCYIYLSERTELKRGLFALPVFITVINEMTVLFLFASGQMISFEEGYASVIGGIPVITQGLNIAMLLYLPAVAFSKREAIGPKAVSYLGMYGFAPILAIGIVLISGQDFTAVLGSAAVVMVASLLERDEAKKELEKELKIAEESTAEAMLNNEIISSISKLYFAIFRIDLINDFYEEVASDNEVHRLTGHEGPAYQRMMELCDNFVTAEYDKTIRKFFDLKTVADRLSDVETIQEEYLAKDGNWHQARFISKRRDENGRVTNVLYVTRLVSQEKIKELETARMLQAANNAKSEFLFNMSHDIRTPMNAIIGYCDLMQSHFDDKEKCRDYLTKVRSSSDFLLSLINNVLEMAQIESGKAVLDESICDSREICLDLKNVYDELMCDKGIDFRVTDGIRTPYIYCDKVKVHEIYLNLLSNAYKYTPTGGRISMEVKELPSEREGYTVIQTTISDTGIGMSKDYLPHLYDEFSREYCSTENKIQGTGLGMPIVKKLVDVLNGSISVESELGKGTTFVVTIPHRIADEEILKKGVTEVGTEAFEGMRILLAEDNDFNAEIAMEILEDLGFLVDRAEDGIACINLLSKSEQDYYKLILMDIQMPNMDGYKATHAIRTIENSYMRNIPIIAMTANAFESDKKNAFEAGMDGHIAKPIKEKNVIGVITEILHKKANANSVNTEGVE